MCIWHVPTLWQYDDDVLDADDRDDNKGDDDDVDDEDGHGDVDDEDDEDDEDAEDDGHEEDDDVDDDNDDGGCWTVHSSRKVGDGRAHRRWPGRNWRV